MQLCSLASALLLCWPALAVPAPSAARNTPPSIASLGTLQALKYNDLGSANNGTAAVLLYDRLVHSNAQSRCAAIGESLYPLQNVPRANATELAYQLDYLVYANDLQSDDTLWVAKAPHDDCQAYSQSRKQLISVPCDRELPAICTSSVPPTTDGDRTAVNTSKISITFDGYHMTGYRDARSFRFLGIPFADPPVRDLRFAPPRPYSGSRRLDATRLADSCIQSVSSFGTLDNGGISEDCLYLNVYTPILSAQSDIKSTRKPVAVYFYGGGFTSGTSSMIDYDGGNFASRNDVVVVTINYRVGALGWLTTANLTTGNYGTRDQILALKWVNEHIAAFGGDPQRITIFGQSAGGQSVIALLSSSAAHGLFSGAIVQSAPVDLPWFTRDVYSKIVTPNVASAVGCNDTTSETALLSCLRSVPATYYLDNTTEFESAMTASSATIATSYLHTSDLLASIEPLMPIVDDTNSGVIDDQFYRLLSNNTLPNRVPTIFTTVTDEAALYVDEYITSPVNATVSALSLIYDIAYPASLAESLLASKAFPLIPTDPDTIRNLIGSALTYSEWTCPQSYLLHQALAHQTLPRLWAFSTPHGHIQTNVSVPAICSPNQDYNATCHTSDVLLAWGTLNSKTQNVAPYYNVQDVLHSRLLNDIFGSFFRTGDPNPDPLMLKIRGPAYASTYEVFGGGYALEELREGQKNASATVNVLSYPPSVGSDPGSTEMCRVFEDFGFTFQRAGLLSYSEL
ncbi:cholinesterase [Aspergillus heteromorphus CBS 117.55]|uniref:Cholinesterase n=1 Tax=Aspergillus heteromorphus CBS 117.55 TaxID=1448321 RepID=A0A317VYU8_9EURO|nr:cholinesterase [Aspergillus heteromorphus CBS 117.55]PWY77070.1 cholinesterase [Aspergillus heteromorphus CBS 117.55]